MKHLGGMAMSLILSAITLYGAGDAVSAERPIPGAQFAPTNDAERSIEAVLIPEVEFRAANLFDCIDFVQFHLNDYASSKKQKAPRFVYDIEAMRYITATTDLGPKAPELTFKAANISAFRVLKLLEAMTELHFVVKPELIIVEKKEIIAANKLPENIVINAPNSKN